MATTACTASLHISHCCCCQVVVETHFSELGGFGVAKNWVALVILIGMLVAIATEKVRVCVCVGEGGG